MARLEEFDDVQLDVEFTQAGTRSNLTSKENIAISFGKIAKWYEALVPTGGSSGQFLGFNSSGTAKWVSNPNVDEKVKATKLAQSTADASYYPTLVAGEGTAGVNIFDSAKINHTKGTTSAVGNTRLILGNATNEGTANNEEGLLRIYSPGTKYHTLKGAKITTDNVEHTLPTTGGTILNTGTTSFTQTLSSGTKIGTIKINGTSSDIYAPTNTDTKVTDTVGTANTYYPAGGTSTSTTTGTQVFDTSLKFIGTTGSTSAVGKAQLVLGNATASGTANNKQGSIVVYGSTAYAHTIQGAPTAARTLTLPDKTGTFALTSDIPSVPTVNDAALTLKGAGTTVTTFTANASSAKSLDIVAGSNVTVTADATNAKISIASSHPTITKSTDTTSTASPAHGGTFTVVDSITREANGHVTKINTKTVTLPADSNTDTKVTQSATTTTNYRPILFGAKNSTDVSTLADTITDQAYTSTKMFAKPETGILYASGFSTSSYITGTGAQLAQYGLYLKSYKSASLPAGGDYSYSRYALRVYDGKSIDNNGMLLTIDGGGLTIVGGGESASSLANLISDDQRDSNTSRSRLNVGGTLNTAFTASVEQLILSSDNNIYFLTKCNTIADRKPVVLDTNSYFYPGTTKTGSIGTSSYMWNSVYAATIYENGTSLASKYAAIGHTHTTTITADSGTNQLTLAASTKYKLTTGGTNFIFTTPPNTTYSAGTGLSLSGTTFNHSNSVTAVTSAVFKKITYDAQGHITGTANVTASDIPSHTHSYLPFEKVTTAADADTYTANTGWYNWNTTSGTNMPTTNYGILLTKEYPSVQMFLPDTGTAIYLRKKTNASTAGTSWMGITGTAGNTYNLSNFYNSTTSRTANTVLAAPNGSNGGATFRKLVAADIPSLNYSKVSISRNLTSGTKVGTITIDGTSTDLYCQTNTNTTYTFATGDSNGQIKVTPSSGSAYNVAVKGLGSAAYTASTSYVPINGKAPNGIGRDGYVAYAHDGFLNTGTGTVTGALVITTPFTKTKGEVMLKFTVDIYNYKSNTSVEYKISGYAFNDGKWYNCTAYCVSSGVYSTDNIDNLTVRFGYVTDGFYQVQIGETTTNKWNYPRINVHDISVTYNRTNYTDANSGWSLEFVTSGNIPNITQTITNTAQRYLPLAGGTMTGTLTAKASQTADAYSGALNMNNSNIYGVNAIYTADASDGAAEGIHFYRDATHVDTLWMNGGSLLFVPNRELGTSTTVANSQKVARFTANPTTGQVVITDGTTGGIKSSGYTIAKSVPSNAVFTDHITTVTSSGSGNAVTAISADANGALTVTKGSTFSLSTHTHSYAGSSSAGGAANSANVLNYNNSVTATTSGLQYTHGGMTIGTADGNAKEGSDPSYKLWSYPTGGTATNSTSANIQNLRLYWSSAYFRDIFLSPNNDRIYHRAVINNSAKPWYVLLDSNNLETYSLHTPDTAKALSTGTEQNMSPITRPQNLYNRSNKLALIPGSNITVEYSTDAGSKWTDMGLTADKKGDLFNDTISATIPIGPNDSTDRTTSMQTRITITCDGRDQMIDQYILWLDSSYQTISIDLQVAYGNATTTFTNIRTGLSCPPWNYQYILNTETKRFGTNTTSAYVNKIRFVIKYTGINGSHKTSKAIIHSIAGYSGIYWGGAVKNNLMIYDHLYTWDNSQNATFPAQINATGGTITNSEWKALIIKRTSTNSAGVHFENNNGYLGAIGMDTVDGTLKRWKTNGTTGYEIIDRSVVSSTPSAKVNTNWNTTADRTTVVTKGWMSFWDGAYNGSTSNLTYCNRGAFGTIVTKSATDYSKVASSTNGKIKIDGTDTTVYTHPSYTSKTSGLYKITVDTLGHVSATASVAKGDIPALDYLPLTGGNVSGGIYYKSTKYDGSAADNGVSSGSEYPTTFNILDKSSRILVRLEGVINSTGAIGSYWYVRNYNTSGTQVAQKGISMSMAKDGTFTYAVSDGANFRSAIGAGTSSLVIGTTATTAAAGNHTHSYAGSSSAGGAATSANKLNTNAGSATLPVYFSGGIPVVTTAPASGAWFSSFTGSISSSGVLEVGRYLDFHSTNAGTTDYDVRIDASSTSLLTITSNSGTPQLRLSGTLPRLRFTQTTSGKAYDNALCGISAYPGNTAGVNLVIQSGGNTFIGGGESPVSLYTRIITTDSNPYGTSSLEASEQMFITSDNNIYFVSGAGSISATAYTDWTDLKTALFDSNGCFRPSITDKGSIGASSHPWHAGYINTLTSLGGAGGRTSVFDGNGLKLNVTSSTNWSMGMRFYDNAGESQFGGFGAYGQANTLEYHYIGGTYNAPQIKIEPTGPNLIINSEDASTPMITLFRKGSNKADWRIVNTSGNLKFQSDYTTAVGDWYDALTVEYNTGNITMKTDATFTFGKFASATANANRHVFFKDNSANRICVNDNFKYNPSTNILTVGSITGNAYSATNVNVTVTNGSTSSTNYGILFAMNPNTTELNALRKTNDFRYQMKDGAANTEGFASIVLGNAKKLSEANNKSGNIYLYSSGGNWHLINVASTTSSNVTHTLPATSGTILNTGTTSFTRSLSSGTKIGTIKINGTSTDIYCQTNTNTVLYENTTNPQTSTTITLPNGIPKYLKVFIGAEYSSNSSTYNDANACINCIDVDMAHRHHGGFIGYDTPGQSGVENHLAYCYVYVREISGSTTQYSVGISYASFLNLATSATVQNVIARIVKIIAVY